MELTTIAKPYAKAVFEIAQQNNTHAQWQAILEAGASIANDATICLLVESPNVSKQDKLEALIAVLSAALNKKLDEQENTFVQLLLNNERISALPSILELFSVMSNLNSDAKTFHVVSAHQLDEKEKKNVIKDLSDRYKTTVNIDVEVDENLIGGLVIKEGDRVIDLSIKARVNALGSQLSVMH